MVSGNQNSRMNDVHHDPAVTVTTFFFFFIFGVFRVRNQRVALMKLLRLQERRISLWSALVLFFSCDFKRPFPSVSVTCKWKLAVSIENQEQLQTMRTGGWQDRRRICVSGNSSSPTVMQSYGSLWLNEKLIWFSNFLLAPANSLRCTLVFNKTFQINKK